VSVTNSTFSGNNSLYGGGIRNAGTLTVTNSTFSGNSADYGGGIYNADTLTVVGSTFSGNSANDSGGGILNAGTLTVTNSTFSGNSAYYEGGGIYNFSGTLTVVGSTFSGNSAPFGSGGGILNYGDTLTVTNSTFSGNSANTGGGIRVFSGTATLKNTIVANSTSGGDCVGSLSVGSINNLIESTGSNACGLSHGSNGNIVGVDPNLGALIGSPAYFPLNAGSPAIDAGDNATCAAAPVNNQSQNGVTRPQDGDVNGSAICDIGSYEAEPLRLYLPLVRR
jgi:predicted outer membrane repeat protein